MTETSPIQHAADQPAHDDPHDVERRLHRREPVLAPLELVLLRATRAATMTVYSEDLSPLGIGFLAPAPLPVGQLLALRLSFVGLTSRLALCRVTNCTGGDLPYYRVGASFIEMLDEDADQQPVPASWTTLARTEMP